MRSKMFVSVLSVLAAFTLILATNASAQQTQAKKLMLDGYHVISTFHVEFNGGTEYTIKFPKDQFQENLNGVDTVAIFIGVDNDKGKSKSDKIHEGDLDPIFGILDKAGEYYVGTLDRSSHPERFRGVFWASSIDGTVPVYANCDEKLTRVGVDPNGYKNGGVSGYQYYFPKLDG